MNSQLGEERIVDFILILKKKVSRCVKKRGVSYYLNSVFWLFEVYLESSRFSIPNLFGFHCIKYKKEIRNTFPIRQNSTFIIEF